MPELPADPIPQNITSPDVTSENAAVSSATALDTSLLGQTETDVVTIVGVPAS